ncbi:MAG: GWxTD domain-containing protein [Brumimicrobium sp.]|nr:GWxTD domain-containing protein [Brumimicrobium sp.]
MLKQGFLLIIAFATVLSGFSQSQHLKVYLKENQLYAPEQGSYIEIQMTFDGRSLEYVQSGDSLKGQLEITQIFEQDGKIIMADKYQLNSPTVVDSIFMNFYDIQKYILQPGKYNYELIVNDVNSKKEALGVQKEIVIRDFSEVNFSSVIPAEIIRVNTSEKQNLFTKAGYDVIPIVNNYYPTELENLLYYVEIYNTQKLKQDSVILEQKIVGRDNKLDWNKYTRIFKFAPLPLRPIAKIVDIRELPTGAYTLELNLLDKENKVLATTSYNFDRNNSDEINELAYQNIILDPAFAESVPMDSVNYYVASLIPISRQAEVKNILSVLKSKDREKSFKYLQAFWKQIAPTNAFESWIKYKSQVQLVQRLYATNYQVGFETDRGRVYLQYGSPNSIIENPSSPSEYPYEIWQYDKINQYSNKRFVFYCPNNLNNEYRLLHSDMIGEVQNYRWKYALNKRNTPDQNLDDPTGGGIEHFGGNSSRYYNSY